MRMRSVMEHAFSMIPQAEIPRSSFDRSHGCKTTFDAGKLIPIFVDEVLPGDTFNLRMTGFARMATPIFPVMDNIFMETFFFFVPYRLLWDNWERFNGAQDNPADSTDFTIPVVATSTFTTGTLADYFGLPVGVSLSNISALPFRAYNLIYNEWFRDENIVNSVSGLTTGTVVPTGDGPDTLNIPGGVTLSRGKRHDYFTSCLPWPQKGDSVALPLGTDAQVVGKPGGFNQVRVLDATSTPRFMSGSGSDLFVRFSTQPGNSGLVGWDTVPGDMSGNVGTGLYADLSDATAATINQLRQAFQIQRLLERDARGGTRYTEILRSHFGVISPDGRLQRPEYLGGGSSPVNVTQVPQTSETSAGTPQGNLAAYGTASLHNHGFVKSFTEHGVIIGLMNVRADLTYQQGINRMWSRATRFDFYWPALSHIGEQAVLSKEIYADGSANDETVFGYQERYAEYRYKPSSVTGLFRSNPTTGTSLDSWHLSQEFTSRPLLNSTFIAENPPIDRVIAVPDEPHFLFDAYFNLRCARPMPMFGVPGMIDHF